MNMDEDIWIGSVCSSVTIAKQGLILVISKGSDKNMLVPCMPPDWQFISHREPDVKSHMLTFSTQQSFGLHSKMHQCWQCWTEQTTVWKRIECSGKRSVHCSAWQRDRGSRGVRGCSGLCPNSWHLVTAISEGQMQQFTQTALCIIWPRN